MKNGDFGVLPARKMGREQNRKEGVGADKTPTSLFFALCATEMLDTQARQDIPLINPRVRSLHGKSKTEALTHQGRGLGGFSVMTERTRLTSYLLYEVKEVKNFVSYVAKLE